MKKIFMLLATAAVIASALGVQVSRAQAADWITYEDSAYVEGKGIVYIFDATGFRNKDLKDASIYVGSDFYDLFCWVLKEEGKIVCNAQGGLTQFAGQTAIIYLAGQIFYVTIPSPGGPHDETPLTCPQGQVPGANYDVDFGFGLDGPYFVPGADLTEVANQAASWYGSFPYQRTSSLICGVEPS